jgi:hypothetical protein
MFARVSCSQCNHQHCPRTFSIYVVNDQLQLCIHPCSDDVNRQWQQCSYRVPIHIVYPEDVLSQVQITSNHVGARYGEWGGCAITFQPQCWTRFCISRCGYAVLHCHGAKWHHAGAVVVVYSEKPASRYAARVRSNIGHWLSYILARDGQEQVHFGWSTWRVWLSEHPDCAVQFSSSVTCRHTIRHSVFSAKGHLNASMTTNVRMLSRNALA